MGLIKAMENILDTSTVSTSKADEDRVLVERVQSGDVHAFDSLVLKYRERIYSVLYNITSNREDAADFTQETFIKAFTSIKSFKGKSSFYTWLYRIGVNHTIGQQKKNRLRRFFSLETINDNMTSSEVVEHLAEKRQVGRDSLVSELQEKLNDALQKLSINHRTVVVLFEIEGLSHQEIAEIMNCSEGTVRSRLHYAKQQLQSFLQDYLK